MDKVKIGLLVTAIMVCFSGCATVSSPVLGTMYTDVQGPVAVTGNSESSKVGSAEAVSYLGIVAQGDASIQAAAESAGITTIHHVDFHSESVLGVYAKYTVYVYGE